jgi:hyperosmotically inducible protein
MWHSRGKGIALTAILWSGLAFSPAWGIERQGTPPDNTRVNARDRKAQEPTAGQQGNRRADVELSRRIRRAIVADKSLSTYAHNIKVITRQGKVTLKGPVRTEEEKKAVESKAADVVGPANVISEVSVTNTRSTTRSKHNRS